MQLNNTQKTFISILLICFVLFLGGSVIRSAIAFDIFLPNAKFELKPEYTNAMRMQSMYVYAITAFYTDFAYGVSFILMLGLIFSLKKHFRNEGWLFMVFALFFLSAPINIFNIYYDYKLNEALIYNHLTDFNIWDVQHWFVDKYKNIRINSAGTVSFFTSVTCLVFIIWQPLKKSKNNDIK